MDSPTSTAYPPMDSTTVLSASANLFYDVVDDDHQANQITFEIPSNVDLERIKSLDNFTNLLHRISNSVLTASSSGAHGAASGHELAAAVGHDAAAAAGAVAIGSDGHVITKDQISGSVVLNLADLQSSGSFLERFFNGADMHSIINYLWIGVVTSLIILSVIFIIFSCYFYRKFREWKKCNKDIRSHLNGDMYPNGAACGTAGGQSEAGYYQMESPPCYTIATGLPSYDEALSHQAHFAFGMKFLYPVCPAAPVVAASAAWEKETLNAKSPTLQQHSQRWQNVDSVAATTLLPTSHIRCIKETSQLDTVAVSRDFQQHQHHQRQHPSTPDHCSEVVIDA